MCVFVRLFEYVRIMGAANYPIKTRQKVCELWVIHCISAIVNMLHHVQPGVFLEQACLFKDAESCHKLFQGKIKGLYGLKRDPIGAVDACEEACRRNVVKACYNAYKIHSKGLYVPPDQHKANHYFNLYNELVRPVSKDNFEDDSERDADRVAR